MHPPMLVETYTGKRPQLVLGGQEVNGPDTSNISYGTATDQVRHSRIIATAARDKIFIQELPVSIPEELSYMHQRRASSSSQ